MKYSSLTELLTAGQTLTLIDEHECLTKAEIYFRIGQLHLAFKNANISIGERIAILLPRSVNAMTVVYAIISYGCVYVPIDYKLPESRKNFIIADTKPALVIDETFINNLPNESHLTLYLQPHKTDLAAILYTSGSTGSPKGIALSHQAILFFIEWASSYFNLTSNDRIGSLAPLHFDLSLFDLFTPWYAGCQVFIIPENSVTFPSQLTAFLVENAITIWYTVPSMLQYWQQKGGIDRTRDIKLRSILFAGEVYPLIQLKKLMHLLPNTKFFNLFGPTETNVCTIHEVNLNDTQLSIGKPLQDIEISINDENNTLMVKGPNLFSGYWINGELKTFNADWYDTGDVIRAEKTGELYYLGRKDRMVKILGHRVELSEIENRTLEFDKINEAVVIATKNSLNIYKLSICYVASSDFTINQLKKHLQTCLPYYMIPENFKKFISLPRLSNGKLDLLTIGNQINHDE